MRGTRDAFIVDAGALLDFCRVDRALLTLIAEHVGAVNIAEAGLLHVSMLDRAEALTIGIEVVCPELSASQRAARLACKSPLRFDDWLCVVLAEERGWGCISHEPRMHAQCAARNTRARWGFHLLGLLVEHRVLSLAEASSAIRALGATGKRIPSSAIDQCVRELESRHSPSRRGRPARRRG